MSAVERARVVFTWCRAHPKGTEEELMQFLFGAEAVKRFAECRWVKLTYGTYHSSDWSEEFWLTEDEWELLEDQPLNLGEIDGKHSDVSIKDWSELTVEQTDDPYEIAARIGVVPIDLNRKAATKANDKLISAAHLDRDSECGQVLERQEHRRDRFFAPKYMGALVARFFPDAKTKPNTTLERDEKGALTGCFADDKLQDLMDHSADEMSSKRLWHKIHSRWQRAFVEYLDATFGGGRSAVLDEEQPWFER